MPLKHTSLLKAYSGLQCCVCTSTSPSVLPIPRARPEGPNKKRKIGERSYATVRKTFDFRDNLNWPCQKTKSANTSPTPYDIFDIDRGGVYSKQKFYELVKIYHPDRHSHHCETPDHPVASLSRIECLERYRLVVRAHEILSDPHKRRAYDSVGAGWGEKAASLHKTPSAKYSSRSEDSPFTNATWEDWERWYTRTNKGPQAYDGTYINPNAFASMVILLAVISGVMQATHAGQFTGSIEERAQAFTAQTQQFLTDRKQDNAKYNTSGMTGHAMRGDSLAEDRIRHFLERRDSTRYGLQEDEEETYRSYFTGGSPALKAVRKDRSGEETNPRSHP